jgi:peptide/nickel transport system permease protein
VRRLIVTRIGAGVVTLVAVSLLVFLATHALPGDVARSILGKGATPEQLRSLRAQLGLDRPLLVQYWRWISGIFRGNLGTSLANGLPLRSYLGSRFVNTSLLVVATAVVAIPLSVVLGTLMAWRRGSRLDRSANVLVLVANALPEFVVGVLFITLFATSVFHWLPPVSAPSSGLSVVGHPRLLVLPTLTLVVLIAPYIIRMVRASMSEILQSEYVTQARLNGLPERRLILRHALPNAIAPSAQVIAVLLAYVAGGAVVVETVFGFPGVGQALVEAVSSRDLPAIELLALAISTFYVVLFLLADIVAVVASPRHRTSSR